MKFHVSFQLPFLKERNIYQHVYIFEWLLSFLEATPNNVHYAEEEGKEDLKKIDVQGWNYKVIYSNIQVCGMKITGKGNWFLIVWYDRGLIYWQSWGKTVTWHCFDVCNEYVEANFSEASFLWAHIYVMFCSTFRRISELRKCLEMIFYCQF